MHDSEIVVEKTPHRVDSDVDCISSRLGVAYVTEREEQALTEIELNRAKIVLVDENGKIIQLPTKNEH